MMLTWLPHLTLLYRIRIQIVSKIKTKYCVITIGQLTINFPFNVLISSLPHPYTMRIRDVFSLSTQYCSSNERQSKHITLAKKNFTLNTLGIQLKMYFLDVSSKPQKLLKSFFQAESDYCERGCVGGCAVLVWLCSSWCEAEATAAAFKAGFTDEAGSRRSARHPCPPLCQRRSA